MNTITCPLSSSAVVWRCVVSALACLARMCEYLTWISGTTFGYSAGNTTSNRTGSAESPSLNAAASGSTATLNLNGVSSLSLSKYP
ncbi:hypothetical protein T484DRAFT_1941342 [Baffinella frigidus]|nr:hypothetical protein T484DRAFT_1941342 [Cryptophyta sp. CCMP2293]